MARKSLEETMKDFGGSWQKQQDFFKRQRDASVLNFKLYSGKDNNGNEGFCLKLNGMPLYNYTQTDAKTWLVMSFDFPIQELSTRDACVKHAERATGYKLVIQHFDAFEGET